MRRNRHDGPRAVARQHVVRNEDRDLAPVHGVDPRHAREAHARLFLVQLRALEVALAGRLLLVGGDFRGVLDRPVREPFRHLRVLRRKHHVRRAEQRVAPRRVDRDLRPGRRAEIHQRPRRLADPVALHLLDALRPVERVQILQKPLRVRRDPQHPLPHRTAHHRMVPALGASVDDFLVRQDRPQRRTPVHRNLRHVRQPLLVELLENPLRPLVVLRVRRVDLAVPVVRKAQRADLFAEAVDVLLRRDRRVRPRLDRVLLGRQAERVPPHRMQHVEALHPLVAAQDVRRRVPLGVPHVEPRPRRIREHVQTVELGPVLAVVGFERLVFEPVLLPLLLDGGEIVIAHDCLAPSACSAIAFSISPDTSLVAAATPALTA